MHESTSHLTSPLFGRLTLDAIPYHEPILVWTFVLVALLGVALLGAITYARKWSYLWIEWFTSVDHKKIGIMYMVLGIVMLLRGFSDAIMMRIQQAWAFGDAVGYLPPHHYDQIFTAHGVIMIFFVAMRSEEHTSELQSLMRISYAVFCLKKKTGGRILKTRQSTIH